MGTDVWSNFFTMVNQSGYPGSVTGSTLTFATTMGGTKKYPPYKYYGQQVGNQYIDWESKAFFFSQQKIPLAFDWEVFFDISLAGFRDIVWDDMDNVILACQVGLSDDSKNLNGPFVVMRADGEFSEVSGNLLPGNTSLHMLAGKMENGFMNGGAVVPEFSLGLTAADPIVCHCTYTYDYKTDTLTLKVGDAGTQKATMSRATSYLKDASAYLCVGGRARWRNYEEDQRAVDLHPKTLKGTLDFNSIELPNFDPDIVEFKIYDAATNVEITSSDYVQPGTKVKVVCQVKNTNKAASDADYPEIFDVHFKLDAGATKNFTVDASSPVKVNGAPVNESLSSGVSLKLSGSDTVSVEYVGTIGSAVQDATTVGAALTDDIFGVSVKDSITLVEASSLVEGPGPGDSDLTPGTDYHYTRLPAANENGWNNSPVTVSFYPGDYDTFTITPLAGTPVVLSGASSWVKDQDVDSLPLSYKATGGTAAAPSNTVSDTMRIDTTPPRLSYDNATGLTVDDTPATRSGGVTSGVWHLYATDATGTPTSTVQTFTLTSGKGLASQTVSGVAAGYYVAEDAAGNRSEVLEVKDVVPPTAERPEGSDLPDPPAPTVTTDFDGTKHAVYEETITQVADAANPAFGGSLDAAAAKAVAFGRWHFADADGNAMAATTELLDAAGAAPISSLPTARPGSCTIRQVATDADGNTATVNIHYVFVAPSIPTLTPQGPSDPGDPDSPKVPTGDPVPPSGPVDIGDDGTQTGKVGPVTVTDKTHPGTVPADEADKILTDHFALGTAGGEEPTVTVEKVTDADGNPVDVIDQSTPGRYTIVYEVTDKDGNTTRVEVGYLLQDTVAVPPTAERPEGSDLPEAPAPTVSTDFDGTKHAVYEETITRVADAANPAFGGSLDAAAAKAVASGRWHFTDADGNAMAATTELLDAAGAAPIASLPTARPGSCVIRQVATDADGNTATVNIHYVFVAPSIPTLTPQGPSDPGDPDSPKVPTGDPVPPSGPVDIGDDGTQTGKIGPITVTDKTHPGTVPADEADKILTDHFALGTVGGEEPTVTVEKVTDADGNPVDVIDQSTPGRYTIIYEVTDKDGNTTHVEVDYVLQDTVVNPPNPIEPDPGTPTPPDDGNGSGNGDGNGGDPGSSGVPEPPTVTVKPGDGGGSGSVLKPQPDDSAPNDGRQHVIVADELVVGTRDMRMTPDDFAALFQERYQIGSAQPDGKISAGEVRIYDAQGKRLDSLDRSVEGSYVIEQTFTDSAGNTTTVRLSYRVKAESAVGSLTGDGDGGWGTGDGSLGRTWRTATSLPQTGPFSVLCPLHLLFLALAAVAALYGAVRLRMEAAARRNLRSRDVWVRDQLREGTDAEAARMAGRRGMPADGEFGGADAAVRRAAMGRRVVDGCVLGLAAAMAVALAWSPWCAYDGLLALCVVGLCALCMAMIHVSAWSTARCRRRCWIVPWATERGLV